MTEPSGVISGVDLHLGYHGTMVVEAASITLHEGEVTALVGPNGSGKSTLLRALARLHRPEAGEVRLGEGTAAWDLSAREFARRVTLLTQSHPTPSGVCVRDVVGYGRHPYRGLVRGLSERRGRSGGAGLGRGRWRAGDPDGPEAIDRAMAVTGLHEMAGRAVDELSGGELQRVWLATCLAQDTRVLLLDEPTTFLDLRYQVEILDLVRDLADQHRVAVGIVLHDLNQAAAIADHIVLLHRRRVRASGRPEQVLTEDTLTGTYGIRIEVTRDPRTGHLHTRPIGRHSERNREGVR